MQEAEKCYTSQSSSIAWIGSLQLFFILMGSLFAGYLFDAGHHYKLVAIGSVFQIVGCAHIDLCYTSTEY